MKLKTALDDSGPINSSRGTINQSLRPSGSIRSRVWKLPLFRHSVHMACSDWPASLQPATSYCHVRLPPRTAMSAATSYLQCPDWVRLPLVTILVVPRGADMAMRNISKPGRSQARTQVAWIESQRITPLPAELGSDSI
ncbi:hypothetical protein Tco_1380425, partial [Tanacetum coccineum]